MKLSRHGFAPGGNRRRTRRIGTSVLAAAAVLSAVGGVAGAARPQSGEPVTVRWFVGLGTGAEVEQLQAQEDLVAEFNDSQDAIDLQIEVVDNEVAYETLATQIAAGDAPDIIGPVGVRGSNYFAGNFIDLEPLMEASGFDLSAYDEAQVEFWREDDGALTGVPFGVFPSMIYYNAELFDEAGLDYPPAAYGEPYADGDPWDMDKVAELAMLLTVDANGNDATSPDFDLENVVQWGFHHQFNDDARAIGTFFGPGTFVAEDGSAQIPENWLASWQWYVDLIDRRRCAQPVAVRLRHVGGGATPSTRATWRWPSPTCGTRASCATRRATDESSSTSPRCRSTTAWRRPSCMPTRSASSTRVRIRRPRSRCSPTCSTQEPRCCSTPTVACPPVRIFAIRSSPSSTRSSRRESTGRSLKRHWSGRTCPNHESNMPNFDEAEAVIDEWEDRLVTEPGLDVAAAAEELRASLDPVFAGASAPTVPGTEPAGSAPAGTEPADEATATTSG